MVAERDSSMVIVLLLCAAMGTIGKKISDVKKEKLQIRIVSLLKAQSFISWLAVQGRLRTRDRLFSLGCCEDASCLLCGINERYFRLDRSLKHWQRHSSVLIQKSTALAALTACVYHIWFARNHAFWERAVIHPVKHCNVVCIEVISMVQQLIDNSWKRDHCKWLYQLKINASV